jgi:hypothetical protein
MNSTCKKFVIGLIVLVFAFGCLGISWAATQKVGIIAKIKRDVQIKHPGDTDFRPAKKHDEVYVGDFIKTGPRSRAKILYDDDSLTILAQNSSMEVEEYQLTPKKKRLKSLIGLVKGKLRFVVAKYLSKKQANFYVKTPTAVMGVRGSDGVVIYDGIITIILYLSGNECLLEIRNNISGATTVICPGEFIRINADGSEERGPISTDMLKELLDEFSDATTDEERQEVRERILKELKQEGMEEILTAPERMSDKLPSRSEKPTKLLEIIKKGPIGPLFYDKDWSIGVYQRIGWMD